MTYSKVKNKINALELLVENLETEVQDLRARVKVFEDEKDEKEEKERIMNQKKQSQMERLKQDHEYKKQRWKEEDATRQQKLYEEVLRKSLHVPMQPWERPFKRTR